MSACSARNVYDALDKSKYDVSLIRVEKFGGWTLLQSVAELPAAPGHRIVAYFADILPRA